MKTHTVHSLPEAVKLAIHLATAWGDSLAKPDPTADVWYRGVNDNYDLLPSSYWKNADEESSLLTFSQLVRNVADTSGFDEWDYYCFARHHGIPTRLLDWSEGFLQALFFAFDGWNGSTTPCVWMLRPDELNDISVSEALIFAPGGGYTNMWLPPIEPRKRTKRRITWTNEKPLAIYPARSNKRIIGQLGTFTIHGVDKSPLNQLLDASGRVDRCLTRIDFVGFNQKTVKRELHYLGLRQSSIYPDADHIARDIGYIYDWAD